MVWVICIIWACIDTSNNETNNINKYEELSKLQQLKESGAINEIEFEVEKSKILK